MEDGFGFGAIGYLIVIGINIYAVLWMLKQMEGSPFWKKALLVIGCCFLAWGSFYVI